MSQSIINPKPCSYNCGTRIYWDTSSNSFLEVFTRQKHICKNRPSSNNTSKSSSTSVNNNKLTYYNKYSKQPKPKMSNSLELLSGPIAEVQKKYEILSDVVSEYNGKVHGSQSNVNGNVVSLIVYYEVLEGKRDAVKQKFDNFIKSFLIKLR